MGVSSYWNDLKYCHCEGSNWYKLTIETWVCRAPNESVCTGVFLLCLLTECLSHCLQSCRTRHQICQVNLLTWGRLFLFRVSLHLHMQSWRVTLVNGANSSSQFQFVVLYNWLPLNTLWARAARSAPSPLLIFLHTPWQLQLKCDFSITKAKDKQKIFHLKFTSPDLLSFCSTVLFWR